MVALSLGSLIGDDVLAIRLRRPRRPSVPVWNLVVCGVVNGPSRAASFCPTSGVKPEVSGPGSVCAVFEVEEPAQTVFGFVGGQDPVGVDRFDQFGGDPVEVLVAELGGLLHQQEFAGFDGGGVAVFDLAEGGVDQGDLFGGDQTVTLRGCEVGSDRVEGFAGHAGAVGEVFGGFDPAGGTPDRQVKALRQHPGHGPLCQHGRDALFGAVLDHGPVDDGELVPDPFQRLEGVDQSERAEVTEGAVVDELDQVFHGDVEGVHRGLQRGGCGLVGGGLDHGFSLLEQRFDNKGRSQHFQAGKEVTPVTPVVLDATPAEAPGELSSVARVGGRAGRHRPLCRHDRDRPARRTRRR